MTAISTFERRENALLRTHVPNPSLISQVIFLILIAASFGLGFNQGAPVGAPDNAFAKSNGNGWQCEQGFHEMGHACLADATRDDQVPNLRNGDAPGKVADLAQLAQEVARLKAQVTALSLRNTVLRSERDHDP